MRRRARPVFCLAFLTILFCLFAHPSKVAASTTITGEITVSTTWTKENNPYIVLGQVKVKAPLTIKAGTIVKFSTGSNDGLNIQSDFFVNGTPEEKVVFTSRFDDAHGGDTDGDHGYYKPRLGDWISLNFNPYEDKILDIENASILYSSFGVSIYSSNDHYKNRIIKNCELKNNGYGIVVYNAEPVIENNVISNNQFGIGVNASTRITKITNNSIFNNETGAVGNNTENPSLGALDAKNNWWGDRSGPSRADNPDGKGDLANGLVSYDPWLKQDPAHIGDPVIIIPGIMGSWKKDGEWQIDPIFHTYDNLYEEFSANGYVPEEDLFTFPYEWRDSNKVNAVALRGKIQQIKNKTHKPKVDIVAHSMGGLLAREYIESGYYDNNVDQLITVGTPNLGAPKDYVKWEAGESFFDLFDMVGKRLFTLEALENGYSSVYDYIHERPISSVRELLPVYDYLYDAEKNYALRGGYPNNYPRNEFLEELNNADKVQLLKNTQYTKIIGKLGSAKSVVSGYNVINASSGKIWQHGYPKSFNNPFFVEDGLQKGDGDKTVPLYSAEASEIPADRTIYLQSEHNDLPTEAQKDILEILTGKTPENEVKKWHIPSVLVILLHSPIDMQVISPSGDKIGKDFETGGEFNEIEGAYYTGYDTNTEFLTIPNPEDGEYKIITEGTGTGEYEIEISKITENEKTGETEESAEIITGNARPDVQEKAVVKTEGTKVEKMSLSQPKSKNNPNNSNNFTNSASFLADSLKKTNDGFNNLGDSSKENIANQTRVQKLDILKSTVRQYFKSEQIKKRKEARKITEKMDRIRVYLKRYESETLPKTLKISKTKANRDIDKLIGRVSKNFPKTISEEARNDLVEKLNDLKIVL